MGVGVGGGFNRRVVGSMRVGVRRWGVGVRRWGVGVGGGFVALDELANHFIRLDATHGRNTWQRLSHMTHN